VFEPMKDFDHQHIELALKEEFDVGSGGAPTFDVARYMKYLDGMDIDDAKKRTLLEVLWPVMVAFADIGFGIHPVQQACGKVEIALARGPGTDSDRGNRRGETLKQTFNKAAAPHGQRERKTP
jgi:hypothetical protein